MREDEGIGKEKKEREKEEKPKLYKKIPAQGQGRRMGDETGRERHW